MKARTTLPALAWLALAAAAGPVHADDDGGLKLARRLAPSSLARELDLKPGRPLPQAQASTQPLTLNEAVRQSVARHPSISDAISTLAQQAGGVDVARAGYYPQVRVGVGGGTSNAPASQGGSTGTVASASVSQMLYDFGKVGGAVAQSQALVQRQQAAILKQIDAVAQQAAEAVVMAHRYQSLLAIAQDQVQAVQAVLETARLRANAGLSTKADPIQAESRVDSARANLLQVKSQLAQWRERLGTLLGPGVVPPELAPLPDDLARALSVDAQPDASLLPDVLAAEAERRAASAQLEVARANRYPTLTVDAAVNKAMGGINPATLERNGTYHTVMLNLTSVIYQGGALDAQVRAATAAEDAARMRIETARLNAGDQARNYREQVVGAQARLGVLADRRRSIVEARDLYREQYTLGTRSILDLLNAEQEIYQAAAEQEAVVHDLWASRVGYIGATGQARAFYGLDNTTVQGMELLP